MSQKKPSFLDVVRSQQQNTFIGREAQLDLFRDNLRKISHAKQDRTYIFNIFGQGGVGKSTLMDQFRSMAEKDGAVVARIDEARNSVLAVMEDMAKQYAAKGHSFKAFQGRYQDYLQAQKKLAADSQAPQGGFAFFTRTAVKAGMKHSKTGKMLSEFVNTDELADQAGEWMDFARRKLASKDDVALVMEPEKTLTPLFLEAVNKAAEKQLVCLFFDTYEQTGAFLDAWLLQLLKQEFGELTSNFVMVIAGRHPLEANDWSAYEALLANISLEPFTEKEAIAYLHGKEIRDEKVVADILSLSGRLPVLLATLAAGDASEKSALADPSDTAVERFLKWVNDPTKRELALNAALPRFFNRGVVAVLAGEENAAAYFQWLQNMPFIKKQDDAWVYHEVVRTLMRRYKKNESPKTWRELHDKLAAFYESLQEELGLAKEKTLQDSVWQKYALERIFHRLCSAPQRYLPEALALFTDWLRPEGDKLLAIECATVLQISSKILKDEKLSKLSILCNNLANANNNKQYKKMLEVLETLIMSSNFSNRALSQLYFLKGLSNQKLDSIDSAVTDYSRAIELDSQHKEAFAKRGDINEFLLNNYEAALADYTYLLELVSDPTGKIDPQYYWVVAQRGRVKTTLGQYENALTEFNKAIKLDPNNVEFLYLRGYVRIELERYEEAIEDFDHAIEIDPKNEWTIAYRGSVKVELERYEEAIEDFDRAIEINPTEEWPIASRGEVNIELGRYEEAIEDFNRAIEINPRYEWAITLRGRVKIELECYEEAINDFDRAIQIDPKNDWAIILRGRVKIELECYEEAIKDFDRAIQIDPQHDSPYYFRSLAYFAQKEIAKAKKDIQKAIKLEEKIYTIKSKDWQNTFNLAACYLAAGDQETAEKFYQEGLKGGASKYRIREAIQDLKDFLKIFPAHKGAAAMRKLLEMSLAEKEA